MQQNSVPRWVSNSLDDQWMVISRVVSKALCSNSKIALLQHVANSPGDQWMVIAHIVYKALKQYHHNTAILQP